MSTKLCKLCDEEKDINQFDTARRNRDGLENRCKSCKLERARAFRRQNRELYRIKSRRTDLKSKYGLTEEDYTALLSSQNGCCAICNRDNPGRKTSRYFHIDHCHETDAIRGLLCHPCNVNLGWAERFDINKYLKLPPHTRG